MILYDFDRTIRHKIDYSSIVATANLLPDLDILWYHRSGLHLPLVLLVLALILAIRNRALFALLLTGFWSHSVLDIFLFDNSNHTIKNLANQVVVNGSLAQNIEENITRYTTADGIMLFYPSSNEKLSITLGEENYAIMASFIVAIAVFIFVWLYFREMEDIEDTIPKEYTVTNLKSLTLSTKTSGLLYVEIWRNNRPLYKNYEDNSNSWGIQYNSDPKQLRNHLPEANVPSDVQNRDLNQYPPEANQPQETNPHTPNYVPGARKSY